MFQNKVVILTGATGGIGTATAKMLAESGARLSVQSTSHEKLSELIKTLGLPQERILGFVFDIRDEKAVENMVAQTAKTFGTIDILINNAGKLGDGTPVTDITEDVFDEMLKINLFGPFFMTKHVLRYMKTKKTGNIVTVASTAGLYPGPLVTYTAAKHALIGFMKCTALQAIRDGIRMNVVAPGAVDTPMMTAAGISAGMGDDIPGFRKMVESGIPDGRYASSEEVANTICYFASDVSSHVVGQVLVIDGGEYL